MTRNSSAALPALALVVDGDLAPPTSSGDFAVMEANAMGTLGTPADGFHLTFDPVVTAQADDPALITAFDTDITAAGFTPGHIQATIYKPIGDTIGTTTPVGDSQLAALNDGIDGTVSSPTGGGGTGGGGGAPGGCAPGGPPLAQPAQPGDFGNYVVPTNNVRVFNPRKTGDAVPQPWYISSQITYTSAVLLHGDAGVWGLQITHDVPEHTGPPLYDVILTGKTGKAGHFAAVVGVTIQGQKQVLYGAVIDVGICKGTASAAVQQSPTVLPQMLQLQSKILLPAARAPLQPSKK